MRCFLAVSKLTLHYIRLVRLVHLCFKLPTFQICITAQELLQGFHSVLVGMDSFRTVLFYIPLARFHLDDDLIDDLSDSLVEVFRCLIITTIVNAHS